MLAMLMRAVSRLTHLPFMLSSTYPLQSAQVPGQQHQRHGSHPESPNSRALQRQVQPSTPMHLLHRHRKVAWLSNLRRSTRTRLSYQALPLTKFVLIIYPASREKMVDGERNFFRHCTMRFTTLPSRSAALEQHHPAWLSLFRSW